MTVSPSGWRTPTTSQPSPTSAACPAPCTRASVVAESAVDRLLADARARLDRVQPEDLAITQAAGALLVDIRPESYRTEEGELPDALIVDRNHLEWWLDPTSDAALPEATRGRRVIVPCNEGH